MKRWLLKRSKIDTAQMAQELGVRRATAAVLANRGLFSRRDAVAFLSGTEADLGDANGIKDMAAGVALLAAAIRDGKRIVVYGDYDVDGVMSSTILYQAIRRAGGDVRYYVPHRQREGYGLNLTAAETLAAEGVEVLLLCDNGIAAVREIARAKELGMTVVMIDHHEPGFAEENGERRDILPQADAVIDPKQRDCPYPFTQMCAGGLSYRFVKLLLPACGVADAALERQLLGFAAIATVCDIVDLLGENRILVRAGLPQVQAAENIGLRALIAEAGLEGKTLTEYHIGFVIGPCINAAGRLEDALQAIALFCETDAQAARERARALVRLNEARKQMTEDAAERAMRAVEETSALQDPVLVLYDGEIHESIAGIVAGRVKDAFYRPTILITNSEDGAKGSGRSIEGYHLFEALFAERDLFTRFGGHAMAAGLSLPKTNIDTLRARLNVACTLTEEQMTPLLRLEGVLSFSQIDLGLAKELQSLAPFGKANPAPVFATKGVRVDRLEAIGKNKDILRLTLAEPQTGIRLSGIAFDGVARLRQIGKDLNPPLDCDTIIASGTLPFLTDIAYSVDINDYMGRQKVQLVLKDFRVSN